MDRSGMGSYMRASNITYSPEKITMRVKQMEREITNYREAIAEKN